MMPRFAEMYARVHQALHLRLRTLAGGRCAGWCRPTSIALLLTERCNARCVHCDIWKNRGKEDRPTLAQWKSVLRELRRWLGPVHVVLTGGEALLVPFATELVAHGSRLGLLIELLTHGYWLDQMRIEKLALARPWRVTMSFDGLGETHDHIRGRKHFFDAVTSSLATLQRVRQETGQAFRIRLKTVIMEHNLDGVCDITRFARQQGVEVFYQPIEQNYNTAEDPRWFEHSPNWPRNPDRAVAVVEQLLALKRQGYPIANSVEQLQVMIPYFRDPDALRVLTQNHQAHDLPVCSALTTLQIQANGDVKGCWKMPAVGNIKTASIRTLWEQRPRFWEKGCCLEERMSEAERVQVGRPKGLDEPRDVDAARSAC
jgi:MoaA/NifB/PqqE/SkfB family radical SAM enzyme